MEKSPSLCAEVMFLCKCGEGMLVWNHSALLPLPSLFLLLLPSSPHPFFSSSFLILSYLVESSRKTARLASPTLASRMAISKAWRLGLHSTGLLRWARPCS